MKKFNDFTNESIRDQMTSATEEDIRKKMGEENYKKYQLLTDAKDSIKSKMLADDIVVDKKRNKIYFSIQISLSLYTVSIENDKWKLELRIDYAEMEEYYDTWDEVKDRIKSVIKDSIMEDINETQKKIDELQDEIESDKKSIELLDEMF